MRFTNRHKDALAVTVRNARIVVTDDAGDVVWEDHDESRMILRLFEFAVARESLNALTETSDVLQRHEGLQPHYESKNAALIARNRLIVAEALPTPRELERLLTRSTQLGLWGERAA